MLEKQSTIPIYKQIIEFFEREIASGRLQAGDRIDSIRSLALLFKVNPNTVQKSLNELERDHLIYTDRTNGKFVSEDKLLLKELRENLTRRLGKDVSLQAKSMGLDFEETMKLIKEVWEGERDE